MEGSTRRFACTQCGKCCDRSPEVELSEAAPLAGIFVFRLMFRMYGLPRVAAKDGGQGTQVFYQKKRLLMAHSARSYPSRIRSDGKTIDYVNHLMISAIAVDTRQGECAALNGGRCGIYDRRPLGCRTVPFHYSRPEGLAAADLDKFVATSGYRCDVGPGAPLVMVEGKIVDAPALAARREALKAAEADRPWKEAIVRQLKTKGALAGSLPTLRQIEDNAHLGALTTSMRTGWQIARDSGFLRDEEFRRLLHQQRSVIDRELAGQSAASNELDTLREMRAEYELALHH